MLIIHSVIRLIFETILKHSTQQFFAKRKVSFFEVVCIYFLLFFACHLFTLANIGKMCKFLSLSSELLLSIISLSN